MRIGLIIYGDLNILSGGYLYDRKLVEYLRASGDEVEVIALPWRSYPRHLLDNYSGAVLRRLRAARVDIFVQDELNHPSLFHLNQVFRRQGGAPLVAIVHHLRSTEVNHARVARMVYRWVERQYLRSVDGFIYNSQSTCRETLKLRGSAAPGVVATPAGDRFGAALMGEAIRARVAQKVESGRPGRLLFIGNLIERKGLHTLLEALAKPAARKWQVRIVGREDVEPRYTARVHWLAQRLGERAQFLGRLDDTLLRQELAAADALAVPSSYEGFGIVYLEGLAFGLPAIAGAEGGAAEIVTQGESGFLIPLGGAEQIATALGRLEEPDQLLSMSVAARRRFDDFPTWEQTAQRVRAFLGTWR